MKKWIYFLLLFLILWYCMKIESGASENITEMSDFSSIWDTSGMEKAVEEAGLYEEYDTIDFSGIFGQIITGDLIGAIEDIFEGVKRSMFGDTGFLKSTFLELLVLSVAAGVLGAFMHSFETKETAQMGSLIITTLLFTILLSTFTIAISITKSALTLTMNMMNVMLPVYYTAVAVSGNTITAFAYYRLTLIILYLMENVLLFLVLPMVSGYVLLALAGGFWQEDKIDAIAAFLKKAVHFILKTSIGMISGISILQTMVTPAIDSLKSDGIQKTMSMIPGIGNAADGLLEISIGSAVLIKNSVGVFVLLFLAAKILLQLQAGKKYERFVRFLVLLVVLMQILTPVLSFFGEGGISGRVFSDFQMQMTLWEQENGAKFDWMKMEDAEEYENGEKSSGLF